MPNNTILTDIPIEITTKYPVLTSPIDIINDILTAMFPNYEIWVVGLIAFIIAYFIKRKEDKSIWWAILVGVILFSAFRYWMIGV